MHYQCPECNSYLDVEPMDIFKTGSARGRPSPGHSEKDTSSVLADTGDFLWQLPGMIKNFFTNTRE